MLASYLESLVQELQMCVGADSDYQCYSGKTGEQVDERGISAVVVPWGMPMKREDRNVDRWMRQANYRERCLLVETEQIVVV